MTRLFSCVVPSSILSSLEAEWANAAHTHAAIVRSLFFKSDPTCSFVVHILIYANWSLNGIDEDDDDDDDDDGGIRDGTFFRMAQMN